LRHGDKCETVLFSAVFVPIRNPAVCA
jgi:hypothetical protein